MADEKKKKKKAGVRKSVERLIDVKGYDRNLECYILQDGYMDILQIISKDLVNSSEDEVEYDCLKFAKLYRTYADDLKIIAMNFPCNTDKQQRYLEYKISRTNNEVYKQFLKRKQEELVWLGQHDTTREYYFMIFAKEPDAMKKNRLSIKTTLGMGKAGLLAEIKEEKKHQILEMMANKCHLVS